MADDETNDTTSDTDVDDTTTDDTTDELGAAGQKALDAFKARARTAEKDAKAAKAELDKARSELEAARAASMSDAEKAIAQAREEAAAAATAEADTKYRTRLDGADIRAAAKKFADPAEAILFIDPDDLPRNDDGSLDAKALSAELAKVLEQRPHLAAKTSNGSADGGARGGSTEPQLTRADLASMPPEAIVAAKAKGQLNDLMGVT